MTDRRAKRVTDHATLRHALQVISVLEPASARRAPAIAKTALAQQRAETTSALTVGSFLKLLKEFDPSLPVMVSTSDGRVAIEGMSVLGGRLVIHTR